MKIQATAAAAALLLAAACLADGVANPADDESSFDGARLADALSGSLADPAKDDRIRAFVSQGSKVSATLTPDSALGPTLVLCDDAGTAVDIAPYDKTKPGSSTISWKNVPIPATGGYSFILRGAAAGAWTLKLGGKLATIAQTFPSPADLGVAGQAQVDFEGLRGGTVSFSLAPTGKSKFKGQLLRIVRPDGSTIDATVPAAGTVGAAKGKFVLDADGVHHLVFVNAGSGIGPWVAKTTVKPPKLVARRVYVSPQGDALVPIVLKVTPPSDFHGDDAAAVTLTGRDFQPGLDVRLVRNGFADIVATDVVVDSETQIRCTLDLATAPVTGKDSTGTWNVGVWNAPVYGVAGDPTTLAHDSPTHDQKKTFACVAAGSITLPNGVTKATETWQLDFDADFQTDLNRMGLGSGNADTAALARNMVESYVVCFLRVLFEENETTGAPAKDVSPAVSFVTGKIPTAAGKAGVAYDRIEIGGTWQTGDPTDPNEPLLWGFAPLDASNAHLDDLSASVDDGAGGTTRLGYGVRTAVLDPGAGTANSDWAVAMAPLLSAPLTASDGAYFASDYAPVDEADAARYAVVVGQVTRASREIAALVAHQIGRAMGLAPGGSGPMANPATAGYFWPTTTGLSFNPTDLLTLRGAAKPVAPPGKSGTLTVKFFPFLSTQPSVLPTATAVVPYSVAWNYVGGRANAVPTDYGVNVTDSAVTFGNPSPGSTATVTYTGLTMTPPLWYDQTQNLFNCGVLFFQVTTTDKVRHTSVDLIYRLNILANVAMLPTALQSAATACNNAVPSQ